MDASYEERVIGHLRILGADMRMDQGGMVAHGVRRKRSYASDWLAGWARAHRRDSLRGESAVLAVSSCSECLGVRVRSRLALRRTLPSCFSAAFHDHSRLRQVSQFYHVLL